MAGTLNACVAGFALLCFVLGLLVSQPKVPVDVNVTFPKLSGESAYSLMALLGGNVISNKFYVHSSMVQVQRRSPAPTLGSLFHDHLFSILFIFTGVFLVNYVLLSSAADESSNITLVNFQDGIELMNQKLQVLKGYISYLLSAQLSRLCSFLHLLSPFSVFPHQDQ
jgi:ethylene-insensitive protein 2